MNQVRVADLSDTPGVMLYCDHCGAENSANPGDYFMALPEMVFKCCKQPMRLVTKRTVYEDWRAE